MKIQKIAIRLMLILLLICIFQDVSGKEGKKNATYDLAVCAIFRNEAPYLKEWIEFHRLVGVEHFFLYNNLSTDNYQEVLKPYIDKNIVELTDWSYQYENIDRWSPIQCSAYDTAIKQAQGKVKWMALLDIDEFLFPIEKDNLVDFLKKYNEYAAVCVNWQMYGTSHVSKIPEKKLLIETLHRKAPYDFGENQHVKSIVQPSKVNGCPSPHICEFIPGSFQVNENMERFEGAHTPAVSVNKIRINHYWSRDEDFFYRVKVPRRQSWSESLDGQLNRLNVLNSEPDDGAIKRFIRPLRKKIFGKKS